MTHDDLDFAPPSEEEIRGSERLREALEDPSKANPDADLLRALKSAASPAHLSDSDLNRSVEHALARFGPQKSRRRVVIRVAFGGGLLVAAASILFFVGHTSVPSQSALARVRSTQPLFEGRFDMQGGESARIDRIVVARADDLRENRFARWGVTGRTRGRW